ncbi:MAG: ABC transporter permease [Bifidobacteriaceae bacterium]|jgi:peptide/nickel transport system permease protein|nr:ABC transporter permease [Bifidobacteriaceae bacterium]
MRTKARFFHINPSISYVLHRVLILFASTILASIIIFTILRILPGDTATIIAGKDASVGQVERLREKMGLNAPLIEQYFEWIKGFFTGSLGNSAVDNTSISASIWQKSLVTFPLCILSLLFSLIIALPIGIMAGMRTNKQKVDDKNRGIKINNFNIANFFDFILQGASAIPALWAGLLILLLLGKGVGVLPILPSQGFPLGGFGVSPQEAFVSLLLPALSVAIIVSSRIMRVTKTEIQKVQDADFIRFAMSTGKTRLNAMLKIGLRASGTAIFSTIALTFAEMLTGVVVVEKLFALPGLSSMLLHDIGVRDLIKVQSELLLLVLFILILGIVIDVISSIIDPRIGRRETKYYAQWAVGGFRRSRGSRNVRERGSA